MECTWYYSHYRVNWARLSVKVIYEAMCPTPSMPFGLSLEQRYRDEWLFVKKFSSGPHEIAFLFKWFFCLVCSVCLSSGSKTTCLMNPVTLKPAYKRPFCALRDYIKTWQKFSNILQVTSVHAVPLQRVIVLFPGYPPSPYRSPYWICTQHSHTKGHTSNPWNKCPRRGLMTTGGQIPIEKHYHSLQPGQHGPQRPVLAWHASGKKMPGSSISMSKV